MRLIYCGDRHWLEPQIIEVTLMDIRRRLGTDHTIVHGAAKGADQMAGALAKRIGFEVEREPAQWDRYGTRAAGAVRNAKMLDAGVDAVIGFKNGFDLGMHKGGTEMMVEMGLLNDIPVEVWHYTGRENVDGMSPGGYERYVIPWPRPEGRFSRVRAG